MQISQFNFEFRSLWLYRLLVESHSLSLSCTTHITQWTRFRFNFLSFSESLLKYTRKHDKTYIGHFNSILITKISRIKNNALLFSVANHKSRFSYFSQFWCKNKIKRFFLLSFQGRGHLQFKRHTTLLLLIA
jgi:hypothetical protein